MDQQSRCYRVLGKLLSSPVPLLAVESIAEPGANVLKIVEVNSRSCRDLARRKQRPMLRTYSKRQRLLYGTRDRAVIAYDCSNFYVERDALKNPRYQVGLFKTVMPVVATMACEVHLHASAVAFDGQAVVILGSSGAGKSTLATLLENCGAEHLCDDIVPVILKDELPHLLPAGNGRMLFPDVCDHLRREDCLSREIESYDFGNKVWIPSRAATSSVTYPVRHLVFLELEGVDRSLTVKIQDGLDRGLAGLLSSAFGPFDFRSYLAPHYLPIYGALLKSASCVFERAPRSYEELGTLASRIASLCA